MLSFPQRGDFNRSLINIKANYAIKHENLKRHPITETRSARIKEITDQAHAIWQIQKLPANRPTGALRGVVCGARVSIRRTRRADEYCA